MSRQPHPGHPLTKPGRGLLRLPSLGAGRWLPLLLLLVSLGIAALAILQAQRSVRSHQATAEGLLRDYAAFAAWSYQQRATGLLATAFHQTLDAVHHDRHRDAAGAFVSPEVLWVAQREDADTSCAVVRPGAEYYFRITPGGELSFAGTPPSPAVRSWLASSLPAHAERQLRRDDEVLISTRIEGRPHHIVYATVAAPGEPAHLYGFELEPERYRALLSSAFKGRPLLPKALMSGRSNEDLLAVRVVAATGDLLYESTDEVSWALGSVETLAAHLGELTVHAAVRPEVANSLIIGGLPRSRLPFLAGLFLLSAALAAVAVGQVRREGELARLRSDFVASASHELRTPLAQLRLFLETLRLGRYSTAEQRDWILGNLDRETRRLTNLVDNVLHWHAATPIGQRARAERRAGGGDCEEVPLPEYLEQLVAGFAPLAASRRVRFAVELEPGLVAPLHRESFQQVILNLLDNAAKYGPPGQTVRVVASAVAEGWLQVAVEDEGPGVEAAERERIFEPFRRGRRAIGSVAVGSGIGLAVVREIVSAHGGRAWVEDAAPGGARFVLELPGWRQALPLASGGLPVEPEPLRRVG